MAAGLTLSAVGYVAPDAGVTYLAHHALVIAIPFVLPVFIVVGMVAVIAYRDRHRVDDDDDEGNDEGADRSVAVSSDPGTRLPGETE